MDAENQRERGEYIEAAIRYAQGVVAGDISACRYVRLACQRQLDELAAAERGEFAYRFDIERAEEVCFFIESLPHIRGRWKTANLRLEPWQLFILTTVFGWVDEHGNRRFRAVYIEVPRKNGKSALTAGVGLYMLAADGEAGAECYSLATKREQALAVWTVARFMALRERALCKRFGIEVRARSVMAEGGASYFQALSSDENGLDGLNPHFAGIDELHAHRTRVVHDVMDSATGARAQPLLWEITTAGSDISGVCFEVRDYSIKVIERTVDDLQQFGIIYTLDKEDIEAKDWFSESALRKANPNYGISVNPLDLRRKVKKAQSTPGALSEFQRKHLNVWTQADSPWMDMAAWKACADPTLRLEDFAGQRCWIGEDLASKIDIAAKVRIFELDGILYLLTRKESLFLPEKAVDDSGNASYQGWVADGYIVTTPGNIIDFDRLEDSLREDSQMFEVVQVGYDPHQATQHATRMMGEGFPMLEVRQTVLSLSEPMKELQARVLSGRLRHDDNPAFNWMISNVVAHLDAKDNIYPRKQRPQNKIDGPVAAIVGLAAMNTDESTFAEGRLVAL